MISTALAQTAATATATTPDMGGMKTIIQLILIFVIFYFMLIRPQQKRAKIREQMLSAIGKGNTIIFGGMEGVVTKVLSDTELMVKIADGVEVKVLRSFVSDVVLPEISKTENSKKKEGKEK
ncbi:MAG: preprotein translocase subunit YajC [Alphaproteobacteria bacterium]|nr:preprotein translocase subunit YajC [Alphaproteobacteria bacterium]